MKTENEKPKNKGGRPCTFPGEKLKRTTFTIDTETRSLLLLLGDGDLSKGVRKAARIATKAESTTFT